eukprot:6023324-Amphidinium_carterae.1
MFALYANFALASSQPPPSPVNSSALEYICSRHANRTDNQADNWAVGWKSLAPDATGQQAVHGSDPGSARGY